jgi:PAS domain S-box-containing protein
VQRAPSRARACATLARKAAALITITREVERNGHTAALALALALAFEAVLSVIDASMGSRLVLTGAYVLAPFALSVTGRWRSVAFVSAVACLLALASGWWNDYAGSDDHLTRMAIVIVGGAIATVLARVIGGAAVDRARMAVLAAVGRLSGAESMEQAVKGLEEALVPAAASLTWVDAPDRILQTGPVPPDLDAAAKAALQDGTGRLASDGAVVPLRAAGATIGVLGLAGRRYDASDLAFFEILAGRVQLVLANARLVTDLRSTQARLDGILGTLAEAVTVHDEAGQTVYANDAAAQLLGSASPAEVIDAPPGEFARRFVITTEDGQPVGVEDLPGRRLMRGEEAPPMLTRSVDVQTGRAYWLLTKASALHDHGRLYAVNIIEDVTEEKEAELRQRFLAQAGQALASSLDYEQTLQRVAQLAVPWLADWCAVDLPGEHGDIQQVALAHADPDKLALAREFRRRFPPDPNEPTGVAAVLRGGPAELYPEIPDELIRRTVSDPEQRELINQIGLRAGMVVPMRLGEETLGAITFVSSDSGRTFDDDDFEFAQDLALRAASAVQNARLYREQMRVAHTLQASLLPERLPVTPGWETAAAYQAGEQGTEVGGDFYDIASAAGGGWLAFLGDVTGKGIEAAALTSLVRHSVRTAARFDPRPAAVLALVNDVLLELPRLSPVTLVCALVEGTRVTIAAAGHPRPLLRRGTDVREIGGHGVLLGAVAEIDVSEYAFELEPGDIMLLYTDGVTDTPGEGERFGHRRLMKILGTGEPDPGRVLDRIERALGEFQTGSAMDDRAMLVLRYTGDREPVAGGLSRSSSRPQSRS